MFQPLPRVLVPGQSGHHLAGKVVRGASKFLLKIIGLDEQQTAGRGFLQPRFGVISLHQQERIMIRITSFTAFGRLLAFVDPPRGQRLGQMDVIALLQKVAPHLKIQEADKPFIKSAPGK